MDKLLIVDDIALNRDILSLAFSDSYEILEASNGREALDIIEYEKVAAVLLDLIMPEMTGIEVLKELNHKNLLSKLPVFIVTAAKDEETLSEAYNLGAVDVILKPFNTDFIRKRIGNVIELYAHRNDLEKIINKHIMRLDIMKMEFIEMVASIIEFRDCESGKHVKRICYITKILMDKYCQMHPENAISDGQIAKIANAAMLHDIGKIGVSDIILNKPARLTPEEFDEMKKHTLKGCKIIETFPQILDKETYDYTYDICRHHHERWDGRGYPDGLKGDEISLWSQVVSIADVYDALISPRVYKAPIPHEKALEMINNGDCGIFSPELLKVFNEALPEIRMLFTQDAPAQENEIL